MMVIETLANASTNTITSLVVEIGTIGKWIQAVGLLVIIWIVVQGITLYFNRRRRLIIYQTNETIKKLEKKIDKFMKKYSSRE